MDFGPRRARGVGGGWWELKTLPKISQKPLKTYLSEAFLSTESIRSFIRCPRFHFLKLIKLTLGLLPIKNRKNGVEGAKRTHQTDETENMRSEAELPDYFVLYLGPVE